jgi:hypothetical protein
LDLIVSQYLPWLDDEFDLAAIKVEVKMKIETQTISRRYNDSFVFKSFFSMNFLLLLWLDNNCYIRKILPNRT